jgi:leader peptidase (prepilin peptidase)/N-methyltransferase
MSTLVKILIGIVYGLLLVVITIPLSRKLILNRSEDPGSVLPLKRKSTLIILLIAGIASGVGIMLTSADEAIMVRNLLLLIPMMSISTVDMIIRKIPNPLLLTMIIMQAGYAAYYSITNHTTKYLIEIAFGFALGFIGCTVPSLLRIPVGAGDIKYSGVIGLCILTGGYLQAMIIMGLVVLLLYIVLKITKKGGMKTMIPMGPFLSIGMVITTCFPLLSSLIVVTNIL